MKKGSTILAQQVYAYDSVTRRLATITIKGQGGVADQVLTLGYKTGTDYLASVAGAGATTTFGYEALNGRLASIGVSTTGGSVYAAGFSYYANDRRSNESVTYTRAEDGTVSYDGTFVYDSRDQLTEADRIYTAGGILDESFAYEYDGVGNPTSITINGSTSPVEYNNLNQNAHHTYDARGNLIDNGRTHSWDALDRLASVSLNSNTIRAEFEYDGSNRRTEKRVYTRATSSDPWTLSKTRRYVWSGQVLVAEMDGANALVFSYVWGPGGLLAVTDHRDSTPATYRVIQDATGSVVGYVDASGDVAATFRYDPYGSLIETTGSAIDVGSYRFAGGVRDTETWLQYHVNRYYAPGTGRFLNRDPIAEAGDTNVYRYANGDPVNFTDRSGLKGEARFDTLKKLYGWYYKAQVVASPLVGTNAERAAIYREVGGVVAHEATAAGHWFIQTGNARVHHPEAFEMGRPAGQINGAVNTFLLPADMLAGVRGTGIRIIGEAAGDSEEIIEWQIARDKIVAPTRQAHQWIAKTRSQYIDAMAAAGFNRDALMAGAEWGQFEYTVGETVITSAIPGGQVKNLLGTGKVLTLSDEIVRGSRVLTFTGTHLDDAGAAIRQLKFKPSKPAIVFDESFEILRAGPGDSYAGRVLDGGTGRAFAGHGEWRVSQGAGHTTVPEGTTLTLWTQPGDKIPNSLGVAIEQGNVTAILANPSWMAKVEGASSHLPGAIIPNYTLKAPTLPTIMRNSLTVEDATFLSDLLKPNMGHWNWAACTGPIK